MIAVETTGTTVVAPDAATGHPGLHRPRPLVVAALGGNALLRRNEPLDAPTQRRNVAVATAALAEVARDHDLVVTHGNGPQVGLLAIQTASDRSTPPYPLDVLGAESEGMIGYLLEQGLGNALPGRNVVTLLTQVIVDADDPAFHRPTKPIGPVYTHRRARHLAAQRGWTVAADGPYWRRVVASPEPRGIVELPAIRLLVCARAVVVCAGGGGIPVVVDEHGGLRGVEAVIDKDLSAALLAGLLAADTLLLLTDVPTVERGWGTPGARPIRRARARDMQPDDFAAGSMRPKIAAARRFVESTTATAAIGALADAARILRGETGTVIEA